MWPTDHRSQCNLKLNLRHCTANYRPVLSSERAPYMKNKESNCHSNKCNIWSPAPRGARHQDNWPTEIHAGNFQKSEVHVGNFRPSEVHVGNFRPSEIHVGHSPLRYTLSILRSQVHIGNFLFSEVHVGNFPLSEVHVGHISPGMRWKFRPVWNMNWTFYIIFCTCLTISTDRSVCSQFSIFCGMYGTSFHSLSLSLSLSLSIRHSSLSGASRSICPLFW
jgi:hypothetical protein